MWSEKNGFHFTRLVRLNLAAQCSAKLVESFHRMHLQANGRNCEFSKHELVVDGTTGRSKSHLGACAQVGPTETSSSGRSSRWRFPARTDRQQGLLRSGPHQEQQSGAT